MGDAINNRWVRGAIPALGIHLSIGSVYAWSFLVEPIAKYIGETSARVQVAFSLAIFFLGLSAAFCGPLVEKNIRRSSILSCVCFIAGLLLTAFAVHIKSLWLIYVGYGALMGVGLGTGYISPVKSLMMWFGKQKGLATGIAIMGFGFASAIASVLITYFLEITKSEEMPNGSPSITILALALIYILPMVAAILLIKKPYDDSVSVMHENEVPFKYSRMFKNGVFILVWIMFYLNIHCGLALISVAKPLMQEINIDVGTIAFAGVLMGIFNGAGRLGFSAVSDLFKERSKIYICIFGLSIVSIVSTVMLGNMPAAVITMLCAISATYGAGFSNLPTLLVDIFGMRNISKIHGLTLTAWAIAGITGNQMSTLIQEKTGNYADVFYALVPLFTIALVISVFVLNKRRKSPAPPRA